MLCDIHNETTEWWNKRTLAIDTETTGVDSATDAIVELGAFYIEEPGKPDAKRRSHSSLINPGRPIPEAATAIHNITDEMVSDAPAVADVGPALIKLVNDADVLVGYSHRFDWGFLEAALGDAWTTAIAGKPVLDPLDLVRSDRVGRFWRGKGRHKLTSVAERLGIEVSDSAHRASYDARLTVRVLLKLAHHLPSCAHCADEWLRREHEVERKRFEAWRASKGESA